MNKLFAIAAVLAFGGLSGNAQSNHNLSTPRLSLPLMKKAPRIDGVFSETEWKGAAQMKGFSKLSKKLFPADAEFLVGADKKNLYIATVCETGPNGISQKVQPSPDNAMAYLDDYVELVIVPDNGQSKGTVHHMIINNKGAIFSRARKSDQSIIKWRPEGLKSKGIVKGNKWFFEIAISLSDLGIKPGTKISSMGLRVCRGWRGLAGDKVAQTNWTPAKVGFFGTQKIPKVEFANNSPVVKVLQLQDSPTSTFANIKVSIYNPGKSPIKTKSLIKIHPSFSQEYIQQKDNTIAPGRTEIVALKSTNLLNEQLDTDIKITSLDGKKTFYSRVFVWELKRPQKIFATKNDAPTTFAAKFAFYPYYNKLVLNVDASSIKERDKVKKISVDLLDQDGKKLAEYTLPSMKNYISNVMVDTPNLKALAEKCGNKANFKLVFKLYTGKNKPSVVEKKFVRNVMEWENNNLGKSNIIIPPFTPIKASGMNFETILRKYKLNNLGLWQQVDAAGKNILANGGMKLIAVVDGKEIEIKGRDFKITDKKPWQVKTEALWNANDISGRSKAVWEYDGMMKWCLSINKGGKLDSLKLVIPVLDKVAPLMHTCTASIRVNYGGKVPVGNGKVWSSDKAVNTLKGTYLPYIWIGGTLRGISVFGENDKGWMPSKNVAAQELIRRDGTLELVLNLITKTVRLDNARNIKIGFLATPVKPMPKNWRLTNMWNWYGNSGIKQFTKKVMFYGSCWYWGALTACMDIYPANKDITFWEKLGEARRTGKIDQEFMKKWLKTYKYSEPVDSSEYKELRKMHTIHVKIGMSRAKSMKNAENTKTMFYINARGGRFDTPEGQTFIDEWCRLKFYARKNTIGYGVAYDVQPCRSFNDYSMWYYKKMLTTGACDWFYWDDIFMAPDYNPVNPEVYNLPDGRTQAASGVYGMRNLVKRGAVLQAEMGRDIFNMVHMTNTNIMPIVSLAQISYDWEDHGGVTPFQERYSKPYIQALTIGRQAGNFPAVLANIRGGSKESRKWCERTATGVMLTHELRWTKGKKPHWDTVKLIYDFGYGQPENKVYNYWNKETYPVKISGPDNSSLVMDKKDGAMIMVCDYSKKGGNNAYSVKPDLSKLGLSNNFNAFNLETGKQLQVINGAIKFKLKRHDLIIIKINK
jgi:hypothetical protein